MTTYTPACPACRHNSPDTFYMRCAGCQERRRQVWAKWKVGTPVPAPSQK